MKKQPQWRKMYMVCRSIAVDMIHRNLVAAYPDKNIAIMKIAALNILEEKVKEKMVKK